MKSLENPMPADASRVEQIFFLLFLLVPPLTPSQTLPAYAGLITSSARNDFAA